MGAVPFLVEVNLDDPPHPETQHSILTALVAGGFDVTKVVLASSGLTNDEYKAVLERASEGVIERNALRRRVTELEAAQGIGP